MEGTWSIAELADRAAAALGGGADAASTRRVNGRVRDVPNERLIRWYTTIGLVDPPLARRGRTALYGPRHLLQLVAVKRRQAEGRSIAEIQVELAGATDATLSEIARLSVPDGATPPQFRSAEARLPGRGTARFWAAQPSLPASQAGTAVSPGDVDGQHFPSSVQGVRLAPGVTVILDAPAASGLTSDDLAAIETAARPLMDELRRRGLLDGALRTESPTDARPAEPPGRSS
jgi:DNA-binding transcriptional MerR regulator